MFLRPSRLIWALLSLVNYNLLTVGNFDPRFVPQQSTPTNAFIQSTKTSGTRRRVQDPKRTWNTKLQ